MQEVIYALAFPRSRTQKIFWVGRTTNLAARVNSHRCSLRSGNNAAKVRIMRELRRAGLRPVVIELATVSHDQADAEEARFIAQFRAAGHQLCNLADSGHRHGAASRLKMSQARQGRKHPRYRHDLDNATLARLWQEGLTCAEIATKFRTGASTVLRRLRAAGVKTQRRIGWRKRKRISNGGQFE